MACESPIRGYQSAQTGRFVPFKRKEPQYHANPYTGLAVPCGHCLLCRVEHSRQWAVRIMNEAQLHLYNAFVTLTYADEHLPEHNSLHFEDLQKFWKRLRKRAGELRYYACGEYGDKTNRPHYHACVFGHSLAEGRIIIRQEPTLLWTTPWLNQAWGKGQVSVGALTFETAQYCAAYVTKKLHQAKRYVRTDEETGELIPLEQPRAFMSLKPAIGKDWVTQYGALAFEHDRVIVNARAQKPPRYYDRWLEQTNPTKHKEIKEKRKAMVETATEEETRARAQNAHAHAKSKSKRL